jgi:hypothetical protein
MIADRAFHYASMEGLEFQPLAVSRLLARPGSKLKLELQPITNRDREGKPALESRADSK